MPVWQSHINDKLKINENSKTSGPILMQIDINVPLLKAKA